MIRRPGESGGSDRSDRTRSPLSVLLGVVVALVVVAVTAAVFVNRAGRDEGDSTGEGPVPPPPATATEGDGGPPATVAGNPDDPYRWAPVTIGGGGFVTGMTVGPEGQVYGRTDVAGAYRWNDPSSTWEQMITASSLPDVLSADYEVLSLVASPTDGEIIYAATGDTLGAADGRVLRSDDGGRSWRAGGQRFAIDGNGSGRQGGERLSVDPLDPDTVLFGTQTQGLWRSVDGGMSWERIDDLPAPPAKAGSKSGRAGRVDVPVVVSIGPAADGPGVVLAAVGGVGIVRSVDGMGSWEVVHPLEEGSVRHAAVAPDGHVFMAIPGARPTLVRIDARGGDVTDLSPPKGAKVATVAVDPDNPDRLVAGANGIRDGALWRSLDGGATWRTLDLAIDAGDRWPEGTDIEKFMSAGALSFDPTRPGTLWLAEGMGVWRTDDLDDGEVTWRFTSDGMELVVANDAVRPASGSLLTAQWDRPVFRHPPGAPAELEVASRFTAGWDLAVAPGDPSMVAVVAADHRPCCDDLDGDMSGMSTDGGATWRRFPSLTTGTHPAELRYGNIAISSGDPAELVWVPSGGARPYHSSDGGATWQPADYPGTEAHQAYYLHRHVLAADPVQAGTFYVLDAEGVLRSDDGGAHWLLTEGRGLPPRSARRWNATLAAVPGRSGELWLAPGPLDDAEMGLFHSIDGGDTWADVAGIEAVGTFGLGASTPETPAALYATGRVDGDVGLWQTTDLGATWRLVAAHPAGLGRSITVVAGDPEVPGRIYVGFAGTGFVVGDPNGDDGGTTRTGEP